MAVADAVVAVVVEAVEGMVDMEEGDVVIATVTTRTMPIQIMDPMPMAAELAQ
jgi:hypothetical protein